jgi:lysylphosphatidylglycerol synthetase-like protein (DUF2156 family)
LPTFTLSGKRKSNVRHSVTHAERAGLRVHVCRLADVGELRMQLAAISRAWLSGKMSAEMGFSIGTLGEALDEETLVAVALAVVHVHLAPRPRAQRFGWLPHGHSVPARVPA